MGIDFIGDVHGHAEALEALLRRLGYRKRGGVWQRSGRRAVFLGDYLNRGPQIREAVELVRAMVEAGAAVALMGNHDLNALLWEAHGDGHARWRLSPAHVRHLEDSRRAYAGRRREWRGTVDWIATLPLVWESEGARAVHACWDAAAVAALRAGGGAALLTADVDDPIGPRGRRIHRLLNGVEVVLPGAWNAAAPGQPRKFRSRWWMKAAASWRSAGYPAQAFLPRRPLGRAAAAAAFLDYRPTEPPVFFGHYGFAKPARPVRRNVACLDLAVAQGGPMAAYRWEGEQVLRAGRFVVQPGRSGPE